MVRSSSVASPQPIAVSVRSRSQPRSRIRRLVGEQGIVPLILFLVAGFLISAREIPTSLDDVNYLNSFEASALESYTSRIEARSGGFLHAALLSLIEEPLWAVYCELLGRIVEPENAIRLTTFISLALIGLAATRMKSPYWFLAVWILYPMFFVQINYTQIRQGFAAALAILGMMLGRPIGGFAVASLVHTTFLPIALLSAVISRFRPSSRGGWALWAILILGATFFVGEEVQLQAFEDLAGRRAGILGELSLELNFKFVIVYFVFAMTALFIQFDRTVVWGGRFSYLPVLSFVFSLLMVGAGLFFTAMASRTAYNVAALFAVMVGCVAHSRRIQVVRWVFLVACGYWAIRTYPTSDFANSFVSLFGYW